MKTTQILRIILAFYLSLFAGTAFNTNAQKAALIVQTGHSSYVSSVSFSSDCKTLASGSGDNTIKLWDVESGMEVRTLTGHHSDVYSATFSPDDKILASGSNDKTIRLWDVESGASMKTLAGHSADVFSLSFRDSKTLASGSGDRTIKLWDVERGEVLKTLTGHSSAVYSVSFSSDGRTLASGGRDRTIKLWDVESGKELKTFTGAGHSFDVYSVSFSRNGKTLASGSRNYTIKLWDVQSEKESKTLTGHSGGVDSVLFSSDGKILASGSRDKTIKLWGVETGAELITLAGHSNWVTSIAFSSDTKTLASGSRDNTIKLWDVETGKELRTLTGNSSSVVYSAAFSPDGKTLANGGTTLQLWDLESGKGFRTLIGHSSYIESVSFRSDGKTLASGSRDNTIKLWDVESGTLLRTLTGHSHWVYSISFSQDGRTLASGSGDKKIKIWDVESGTELKTLIGHSSDIEAMTFSPNGRTLASGSRDKTIKLWNVESGTLLSTLTGHLDWVYSVSFSRDGKTLVSAGNDKTIKLWNVESGTLLRTIRDSSDSNSVSFSPVGQMLASGSGNSMIKLWDVESGTLLKTLTGHSHYVYSVSFSPDGKLLASGSNDRTTKIWDVVTGKELCSLIALEKDDWVVTTPEGRFDTSKNLDQIEGLHWIISDDPLKPLPLEIFMRDYYEPQLLTRLLKCHNVGNCGEEFKPVRDISRLNRVQPKVAIKIKAAAGATDLVDVTVEVESMTDDVSISATDRTKKKRLSSGAFDLRLFRDGQLVGVSTPKDKLSAFINDAPRLIAETKASGRLIDTPEDRAWREANNIFKLKAQNVKLISPDRVSYTFRNIKLPKDGRKEVDFTAYAFNGDRVKSTTTDPHKFTIPNSVANSPKKGRAYLISIGVNASENPNYDLRYAANDARKMQEILGARLKVDAAKYSEVIQVPLISDYGPDTELAENKAQKAIIKGVLSLLAGNEKEISEDVLKQIPNREQLKAVEPEDTLIIAYSGHGYADQSGIFYLLPYDIGPDTKKLTTEALQKTISSDELSLWMQDITAAEMIMIIDACHSSAAVQGDGFKPGPMGSRGLGQLAYDKDMKILSATQANNIARELGSLEQGLLTYALLQDGIIKSLADADKNKQILAAEWLSYAEKRVPELYQEVKDGKHGIRINGRSTERVDLAGNQKSSLNLQQPSLFDFKRRSAAGALFVLP